MATSTLEEWTDIPEIIDTLYEYSDKQLKSSIRAVEDGHLIMVVSGSTKQSASQRSFVSVDKLVQYLPRHLLACLVKEDPARFQAYILRGICVLSELCNLTNDFERLYQLLVLSSERRRHVIDLCLYLLIVNIYMLCDTSYESTNKRYVSVGSIGYTHLILNFYLKLEASMQKAEDKHFHRMLLSHPKVDVFIGTLFDSIRVLADSFAHQQEAGTAHQPHLDAVPGALVRVLDTLRYLCYYGDFFNLLVQHKQFVAGELLELITRLISDPAIIEWRNVVSAALQVCIVLCQKDDPFFLDLVVSTGQRPQAQKLLGQVLAMAATVIDRRRARFVLDAALVHAWELVELFSDDSTFKQDAVRGATELVVEALSLPRSAYVDVLLHTVPHSSAAAAPSQPATEHIEMDFLIMLFKLVGSLHCFNPAVSKPQDKHNFLRAAVAVLNGTATTGDARYSAENVIKNLQFLLLKVRTATYTSCTTEDLQLVADFIRRLKQAKAIPAPVTATVKPAEPGTTKKYPRDEMELS